MTYFSKTQIFQDILYTALKIDKYLLTVRWADFKQNCKYFRRNLRWINEYASEIQNIFYLKS